MLNSKRSSASKTSDAQQAAVPHPPSEYALAYADCIYRRAIESTHGVPYQLRHADRAYEFVGPGIVELVGIPHGEITHEMFSGMIEEVAVVDLGDWADMHEYKLAFERGDEEQYQVDYRMRIAGGVEKWISDSSVLVRDETTGEITGSLGILRDITERHAADQARLESEQRFEFAVQGSSAGLFDRDLITNETWFSPRFKELLGFADDEFESTYENWQSRLHPDDVPRVMEAAQRHFDAGVPFEEEYRLKTKSGEYRWFHARAAASRDADGRALRISGSIYDITPRKQAEEALRLANDELERRVEQRTAELTKSNRHLTEEIAQREETQQLLQSIAEGTSSDVGEDFFSSLVRTLTATLGIRYAFVCESLDQPTTRSRVVVGCDDQRIIEGFEFSVAGTPCQETVQGKHVFYPRGAQQLFPEDLQFVEMCAESYCGFPIFDATGRTIGHLALVDDKPMPDDFSDLPALHILASRTAAELQRRQAEKTARQRHDELAHMSRIHTLGEIATGLAHEINQPLTAISAYAQAGYRLLADADPSALDDVRTVFKEISQQAVRASEIIRRLRSLVRKTPARRSTVDVNVVVKEAVELMKLDRRCDAMRFELDLDPAIPLVLADHVQIQQVIINLVQNALDAMDAVDRERRTLSIETSSIEASADDDVTVEVTLSDTGIGLPEDAEEKVFDAFYTAKPEGLGMGLAISRSIIEKHDGRMWATSNACGGATFHFTLPGIEQSRAE